MLAPSCLTSAGRYAGRNSFVLADSIEIKYSSRTQGKPIPEERNAKLLRHPMFVHPILYLKLNAASATSPPHSRSRLQGLQESFKGSSVGVLRGVPACQGGLQGLKIGFEGVGHRVYL